MENLREIARFLKDIQQRLNAPDVPIEISIDTSLADTIIGYEDIKKIAVTEAGVFNNGTDRGVIVYMSEQHSVSRNGSLQVKGSISEYRYHITNCQTLCDFQKKQQYQDKYVSHIVEWGHKTEAYVDGKKQVVKMCVCKHCLQKINYDGYATSDRSRRKEIFSNFDVVKFYKEHLSYLPATKYSSVCKPRNDYPINWASISALHKRKYPKCEFCGRTEDLQTHHISGDKSDCSESNLFTLCKSCHERLHDRSLTLTDAECKKLDKWRKGQRY